MRGRYKVPVPTLCRFIIGYCINYLTLAIKRGDTYVALKRIGKPVLQVKKEKYKSFNII